MKSFLNITLLLIAVFFLSSFELTSKSNLRIINNIEPIDIIEGDDFNEGWEILVGVKDGKMLKDNMHIVLMCHIRHIQNMEQTIIEEDTMLALSTGDARHKVMRIAKNSKISSFFLRL